MNWTRSACCFPLIALAAARLAEPAAASEPIRIDAVLLQLIEQVDVPARDPGVIQSLAAKEGALVAACP